MNNDIYYRMLNCDDMGQMYQSFLEAFSSYSVNMQLSRKAFDKRILQKINIDFSCSPGAFHGEKLVGFIFQTIGQYESLLTAYNGGTGIIKGYRGQGIVKNLYRFSRRELISIGVGSCVLEVLKTNISAQKSYENCGFKIKKLFQCMVMHLCPPRPKGQTNYTIEMNENFAIEEYRKIAFCHISMLDQLNHIKSNWENECALEIRYEQQLFGFIIFQPANGRISQIAVSPIHQKKGIGTQLVQAAFLTSEVKRLTLININVEFSEVVTSFQKMGFVNDLQQYEMQMYL